MAPTAQPERPYFPRMSQAIHVLVAEGVIGHVLADYAG